MHFLVRQMRRHRIEVVGTTCALHEAVGAVRTQLSGVPGRCSRDLALRRKIEEERDRRGDERRGRCAGQAGAGAEGCARLKDQADKRRFAGRNRGVSERCLVPAFAGAD